MSQENVKAFFNKVEEDENLSDQYKSLLKRIPTSDEETALTEVVQFASHSMFKVFPMRLPS
jgi:hypothetical protein